MIYFAAFSLFLAATVKNKDNKLLFTKAVENIVPFAISLMEGEEGHAREVIDAFVAATV